MERLDALCVRESEGKSYFTRIGVAFPAKQGAGFTILLDAMPASAEGQFKILLREPLPPREGVGMTQPRAAPQLHDLDDDVRF